MGFDFNVSTEGTRSTTVKTPRVREEAQAVRDLRATLKPADAGPEVVQKTRLYPTTGLDAKAITNVQGRLNAFGRRKTVEFSVNTQRVTFDQDGRAVTFIEAWAVPKRAAKGKKR